MTDGDDADSRAPRRTKLYGAIDVSEVYPPTLAESMEFPVVEGPVSGEFLVRYRIEDVLGRGGMGEVLSARDDQIGRSVAIKRLRIENPSADVLARFLREARIQGRLEHPAVVPVHELYSEPGSQPFFVMKQLTGTTIAEIVPRLAQGEKAAVERYTRLEILRAFVDVCLAIEFAHTRGVVHRDLKPANIVVGDFGEVYVLDWGIARVAGEGDDRRDSFADIDTIIGLETKAGSILGTPGYISPEQIRGDYDLDGRADVYALGCILFEVLTLQPLHPRGGAGIATALAGVDARASLRVGDREIPPELDAICVRATSVDREQRFQTARDLGTAVQRFLDGNRDVALRQELARAELVTAREALSENSPSSRRLAIRAAARALALDPTDPAPADLVGHLMLEPPTETPLEVEAELERMDQTALRSSARFGVVAAAASLLFFPFLYWIGFREAWYLIAGPSICVLVIAVELLVAPRNAYWSGYIAIAGNLSMFALFAWIVSPVVIGPGPAIIMVTLLVAHRQLIRPWLLALLTATATLTPWIAELAGLSGVRTSVSGGTISIHTAAESIDPTATMIGLVVYVVSLTFLAALLGRLQDDERRNVRRTMQVQAWQLRQLVPRPASGPVKIPRTVSQDGHTAR